MKKVFLSAILLISVLFGKEFQSEKILLCSGAGLIKPMNEIVKKFEEKTGATIDAHYGGSGELFGVLSTVGCDVFIPGDIYFTKNAIAKDLIIEDSVKIISKHVPVIVTQVGNPKNIKSVKDLQKPGLKIVLGDFKANAIGKVSKKIFKNLNVLDGVKKNVVAYAGTVNQLLIYMTMNQADAAIIWEDMVSWAKSKGKLEIIPIPKNENLIKTIPNGIGVMTKNKKLAKAFNDFIVNEESNKIWSKWGFKK